MGMTDTHGPYRIACKVARHVQVGLFAIVLPERLPGNEYPPALVL